MKRSWIVLLAVALLSGLAGVAIAGRPSPVDTTVVAAPTVVDEVAAATTSTVGTETSTTVGPAASPSTTSPPNTTSAPTTTEAPVDRSAVRVLVANATNRSGIAGSTADVLIAAGFTTAKPIDALNSTEVTIVYARAGFEAAAADLASTLGLAAATVQPLGTTLITTADANADLIVAIGNDFQR